MKPSHNPDHCGENKIVREKLRDSVDIYRPLVENFQRDGFEIVQQKNDTRQQGIIFLDDDLQKKDIKDIDEDSVRFRRFVARVKTDYSLCWHVYRCFSFFKMSSIVQELFQSNITTEKRDQHL